LFFGGEHSVVSIHKVRIMIKNDAVKHNMLQRSKITCKQNNSTTFKPVHIFLQFIRTAFRFARTTFSLENIFRMHDFRSSLVILKTINAKILC